MSEMLISDDAVMVEVIGPWILTWVSVAFLVAMALGLLAFWRNRQWPGVLICGGMMPPAIGLVLIAVSIVQL